MAQPAAERDREVTQRQQAARVVRLFAVALGFTVAIGHFIGVDGHVLFVTWCCALALAIGAFIIERPENR